MCVFGVWNVFVVLGGCTSTEPSRNSLFQGSLMFPDSDLCWDKSFLLMTFSSNSPRLIWSDQSDTSNFRYLQQFNFNKNWNSVDQIALCNQVTCAKGELTEVSQHDLSAGVVQDEVQTVAVQTKLRVRVIHRWEVLRLIVRAAGRDKQGDEQRKTWTDWWWILQRKLYKDWTHSLIWK